MGASTALAVALKTDTLAVHQFLGLRLDCTAQLTLRHAAPSLIEGTQQTPVCGTGFVSAIPYLVLVLLMGFSTWYQQRQMQASTASPDGQQAQQMQTFAKIMPAFLMFFAFTFPSGLVIYWLTTNVWTIVQQRIMLASVPPPLSASGNGKGAPKELKKPDPPPKAAAKEGTNGAPSGGKKPSTNGAPRQKQPAASKPSPNAKKRKRR
jgi:YidC/Oxa1 family membrane protein insertase